MIDELEGLENTGCLACRYSQFYNATFKTGRRTVWVCEHPDQKNMHLRDPANFSCSRFEEPVERSRRPPRRARL